MDVIIEDFLNENMSLERADLYKNCIDLITDTVNEEVEDEIINLISSNNGDDESDFSEVNLVDVLEISLRDYIESALKQLQIEACPTCSLYEIFNLCNEIYSIEGNELKNGIDFIIENDLTNEEKLAEVLELTTNNDVTYWLNLIDSVGDDFITNLAFVCSDEDDINLIQHDAAVYKKLLAYRDYLTTDNKSSFVLSTIENFELSEELEYYLDNENIISLFEIKDKFALSIELYTLAMISIDGRVNPPVFIASIIENYVDNMKDISDINRHLNNIHAGYLKFYNENRKQYE